MPQIRIFRDDENEGADARVPWVVQVSRVPCVGESLFISDEIAAAAGPSWSVLAVEHNCGDVSIDAKVRVSRVIPS